MVEPGDPKGNTPGRVIRFPQFRVPAHRPGSFKQLGARSLGMPEARRSVVGAAVAAQFGTDLLEVTCPDCGNRHG
jgi:hypothetical protein